MEGEPQNATGNPSRKDFSFWRAELSLGGDCPVSSGSKGTLLSPSHRDGIWWRDQSQAPAWFLLMPPREEGQDTGLESRAFLGMPHPRVLPLELKDFHEDLELWSGKPKCLPAMVGPNL